MGRIVDNRAKIWEAMNEALQRLLTEVAERIAVRAESNAPVKRGTLRRSISTKRNQGTTIEQTVLQAKYEGNQWIEREVPTGRVFRVPHNRVEPMAGGYRIEVGAYATHARGVEYGVLIPEIKPRQDRTIVDGKRRVNPHLRFDTRGGTQPAKFTKKTRAHWLTAKPYFRPAIDATKEEAGPIMSELLHDSMRRRGLLAKAKD